jgi:hypothetical protein
MCESFVSGAEWGKVKALMLDSGERIEEAKPGMLNMLLQLLKMTLYYHFYRHGRAGDWN